MKKKKEEEFEAVTETCGKGKTEDIRRKKETKKERVII